MAQREIDLAKASRVFKAEQELSEAIHDAATTGLLVEVAVDRFVNGTQVPRLVVKQYISRNCL